MASTFLYGENVHANGIRQHFLRFGGRGTPLVLLPGVTSPAITWGFVAERLGEKYDVYVIDVRGRGLSEASDALDYRIEACAKDVSEFVVAIGLQHYALMGHSFGARIAIKTAVKYPSSGLERMVLVDPPVSGPNRRPYPAKIDFYLDAIRQMARGDGYEAMRRFMPTWSDAHLRLRAEWLHTCNERAVVDAYNDFHQDDMHADLPFISVPTLLIAAGRGDVIRPDELDEIQRLTPGLATTWVPTAGHMIPWDDEAAFFSSLGDFLDVTRNTMPKAVPISAHR
ncbi:alpha/beta fold hydrolase [Glaciimonas sp. PCH181]|uniref:alpha/beta fold hydrolase n=1 Tax=Glaciimonas sp. PCH181 TaxID=2133943 RepID=UPI000D3427B4|nr:alpha/beta hydrolase [Glaciimonas sp. PCH181]PUA19682.1 alpha/beta hydrolase [Glaciimonas sp. PCH181]